MRKISDKPAWKTIRKIVMERDNFCCVTCKKEVKEDAEIDHIAPYSLNSELREKLENLQTLCRECHYKKTLVDLVYVRENKNPLREAKCKRCEHYWKTASTMTYVTCPSCGIKVNVKRCNMSMELRVI